MLLDRFILMSPVASALRADYPKITFTRTVGIFKLILNLELDAVRRQTEKNRGAKTTHSCEALAGPFELLKHGLRAQWR